MSKKDDNPIQDMVTLARSAWRHRKGIEVMGHKIDRINIGKTTLYLDHEIPGLILDTLDNCGFVTRDERRPGIVYKRKTDYGWHLILHLPPGIAFSEILAKREHLQNSTNSWIDLAWKSGHVHMNVQVGEINSNVAYRWDATPYAEMRLAFPVGMTQAGLLVYDLARFPHMLIAGTPGYGKSNFLHVLIHSLLNSGKVQIAVIDPKRLEFSYLRNHAALARNDADALKLMHFINDEMERRLDILEDAGVTDVKDYAGNDMPYTVVVIDEVAEIQNKDVVFLIDRVVRLARACGISVVCATQRPSKKLQVFKDDTRDMFLARLCYQMADEISSRMVLGENCSLAAYLPGIPGRGIFRFGLVEREVQTMFLPMHQARKMLENYPNTKWKVIVNDRPRPKEQPKKRLKPR